MLSPVGEAWKVGWDPFATRTCCRILMSLHYGGAGNSQQDSPPPDPSKSCGVCPTRSRQPFRKKVLSGLACFSRPWRKAGPTSSSSVSSPPRLRLRRGGGGPRSTRPCRKTASAASLPREAGRIPPRRQSNTRQTAPLLAESAGLSGLGRHWRDSRRPMKARHTEPFHYEKGTPSTFSLSAGV